MITWGELLFGAEKCQQRKEVVQLLEEFKTYGAIRTLLEAKGEPIGNNDLWLAAHAKAADLTIVTNNEREFQRVPGLKVQNWVGS